jgi:hypothetical protein
LCIGIQRFGTALERRWLRTYPASELQHKQFPKRREMFPGFTTEGFKLVAGKSGGVLI